LFETDYETEAHDPAGGCYRRQKSYRCEDELIGIESTDIVRQEVSRRLDPVPVEALEAQFDSCSYIEGNDECLNGEETRIIDGLAITACFRSSLEYNCSKRTNYPGCDLPDDLENLSTSCIFERNGICTGEEVTGQVPVFDPSGGCLEYTETFSCEEKLSNIVEDDISSRFVRAVWSEAVCAEQVTGSEECIQTQFICLEGAETRDIEGVGVYQECWTGQYTYECRFVENVNSCEIPLGAVLVDDTECEYEDRSGRCRLTEFEYSVPVADESDGCARFLDRYECENELSDLNEDEIIKTVERAYWDRSACEIIDSGQSGCSSNEVCIEGNETRVIDGLQ